MHAHQKSFAPLNFISFFFKLQIRVKYRKIIWSSPNFSENVFCAHFCKFCKRSIVLEMKFVFKNLMFDLKLQSVHEYVLAQCLYYHCVRFHIKIARKPRSNRFFSLIYPYENQYNFRMFHFCKNCVILPSTPSLDCSSIKSKMMHLSLFWSAVII